MTVGPGSFREALTHVATPVAVITTVDARGAPWGVTVGTLVSLSLSPPMVMFCLDRGSRSHDVLTTGARFLVHVLADGQAEVAAAFAREHGFDDGHPTAYGLPTIPGVLSRLLCVQDALMRGGDHTIVTGSVQNTEVGAGLPLLYYQRGYHSLNRRVTCPAPQIAAEPRTG